MKGLCYSLFEGWGLHKIASFSFVENLAQLIFNEKIFFRRHRKLGIWNTLSKVTNHMDFPPHIYFVLISGATHLMPGLTP